MSDILPFLSPRSSWIPTVLCGIAVGWDGRDWTDDEDRLIVFEREAEIERFLQRQEKLARTSSRWMREWWEAEVLYSRGGPDSELLRKLWLGGSPTPFVNAFDHSQINSLPYNTSQAGSPIPIIWGCQRATSNLIEYWGAKGFNTSSSKGGKGLGSSGGKKGSGSNFSVNVAVAICQGPVNFTGAPNGFSNNNRVWSNGTAIGINKTPVNVYDGADGQAADATFVSSDTNTPVVNYSGLCYVTGTPIQLGSSPALPDIQFEITGFQNNVNSGPSFPGTANPTAIITDMLTNSRYGAGFPSANLDTAGTLADCTNYFQASELLMALIMDRQQPAARWIEEICLLTQVAPFWSETLLKFVPYSDLAVSGVNGATWTPNLTPAMQLTDKDFIHVDGRDPVEISRTDPAAATNWLSVEYLDSSNSYNPGITPIWVQGAIDKFGTRTEPSIQGHEFTSGTPANNAAQLIIQRRQNIRQTYKFTVGFKGWRLDLMDIVGITDTNIGLNQVPVRINEIQENENGELEITAEQLPNNWGISYPLQTTAGAPPAWLADPGNANAPIIFEPPASLTGGESQVWIAASGGSNCGGMEVWVSTDNSSYALAGTIYNSVRQGVLSANLPSHTDPDNTDTLSVDLTQSRGVLLSGTMADADSYVTLCYVGGEFISYQTATLTSSYHYGLTYLRRGAYGTTISAHSTGDPFARIGPTDQNILKYTYPSNHIGSTIYIKLLTFNIYGQSKQDLASVSPYTHVLTGVGLGTDAIGFSFPGASPAAGTPIMAVTVSTQGLLPAGLTNSVGAAGVAATVTTIFDLYYNGTIVGSMTFAAAATTATFSLTSQQNLNVGDVLMLVPRRTDATLAQISGYLLETIT